MACCGSAPRRRPHVDEHPVDELEVRVGGEQPRHEHFLGGVLVTDKQRSARLAELAA